MYVLALGMTKIVQGITTFASFTPEHSHGRQRRRPSINLLNLKFYNE